MNLNFQTLSRVFCVALAPLLMTPVSASAQEAMQRLDSEEPPATQTLRTRAGSGVQDFEPTVEIHGFVDGAVTTQFYLGKYDPDHEPVRFGLDQAEIDVEAQPTERLQVRLDLNWFPDIGGDAAVSVEDLLEQAYFTYFRSPDETGMFLTFGRFNAPIGAESVDRPDMLQYSHGLLFDVATPTNVTGLAAGYTDGTITAQFLIMNDWDEFFSPGDISFGARIDASFDNGSIGAVAMVNDIVNVDSDGEFTFDINGSYLAGATTFIFDFYLGYLLFDEVTIGLNSFQPDDKLAAGAMIKTHTQFTDIFALTARFEYLRRYDDFLGSEEFLPRGGAYHGVEATLAGIFEISENLIATLELRFDHNLHSDEGSTSTTGPVVAKQVALNNEAEGVVFTPAFELTAHF